MIPRGSTVFRNDGRGYAPYDPARMADRPRRGRQLLALLLIVGLAWTVGYWWQGRRDTPAARTVTERGPLPAAELNQIAIFEEVAPSVFFITNIGVRRDMFSFDVFETPQGTGTGFLWDEAGHVVTNYHVIEGAREIEVTLSDHKRLPAEVVGVAANKDIAVLKVDLQGRSLPPVPLGTSSDLKVGQNVFAIGNPFGLDQTMTSGIVSALDREIRAANGSSIHGVVQTDAPINPGNSGGPLLDSAGRLIGVNTAIYSRTGSYAGIGFAVPVDTVNRVVSQLIEHGRLIRPTLGVVLVSDQVARRAGIEGVLILRVVEGLGAARAGLRGTKDTAAGVELGDIIKSVAGRSVENQNSLLGALENFNVGDRVPVVVERDGGLIELEVELGEPSE